MKNILSYSPRSNSVEGQMSKSLEGQIPQIVNSNYLCMVICCEGQGYLVYETCTVDVAMPVNKPSFTP